MSRMQKVLLGGALAAVLLCSGAGLYGYFRLLPRIQAGTSRSVENTIAHEIKHSVDHQITERGAIVRFVVLSEEALDFSSVNDDSGESSIEIVDGDVTISNAVVTLDATGLDVYVGGAHLHAVPAIVNGRFELVDAREELGVARLLMEPGTIEQGIERGMNAALAKAPEPAYDLRIEDGSLVISFGEDDGEMRLCGKQEHTSGCGSNLGLLTVVATMLASPTALPD